MQGVRVRPLVGELRSPMLHSATTTKSDKYVKTSISLITKKSENYTQDPKTYFSAIELPYITGGMQNVKTHFKELAISIK